MHSSFHYPFSWPLCILLLCRFLSFLDPSSFPTLLDRLFLLLSFTPPLLPSPSLTFHYSFTYFHLHPSVLPSSFLPPCLCLSYLSPLLSSVPFLLFPLYLPPSSYPIPPSPLLPLHHCVPLPLSPTPRLPLSFCLLLPLPLFLQPLPSSSFPSLLTCENYLSI